MARGRLLSILGVALPLLLIQPHAVDAGEGEQTQADADIEIDYDHYTLDNGLEVILHRDTTAPLVTVNIWYHVGSGDEVVGKSGFAHLFEHMMFQGAKHIGEDVHFDILREIGGTDVNGTTNADRTNYFETVPSHEIETALWLESDRMGYMLDLLNEDSLANQIDVVRNERRQRYDNVAYGKERFAVAAALYPEGHPYRYMTIGKHEDLESASLEDVRAFFQKWYVPSNATLVVAGDIEIDDAKALVDKWFGSFPKLPAPQHKPVPAPEFSEDVSVEIEDDFARLPRVHWVWHSPAMLGQGDFALDVVSGALGAEGWGRLTRRLVDEEQIAQSVWVYQAGSGFSGAFHVTVTMTSSESPEEQANKRAAVERAIDEEVAKLIADGPTPAEVARHVIQTESGFVWGLESLGSRTNQLQFFNHYTGDPGYADDYLARVRALEPEGVRSVAERYLSKPKAKIFTKPKASDPSAGAAEQKESK
ncbi:insulinase family protein [Pseudenhygromyxa sp. WMMC2535]|uniref:M16 family metallopeptidase n=1 Tax=Pseudenhygromyxa sp. WMMC2535 TaxID=2712867 RepID=UPI0015540041|nr:pitrilysin family protein [Pseudenhygromyxa sp. WMMC2535]NVB38147.1 insulinase family protein [Pseudenhygromyxa sp. WMMC2535]